MSRPTTASSRIAHPSGFANGEAAWRKNGMKHIAITMLCLALTSCVGAKPTIADPIDELVTKLNASHGLWINGVYPIIDLPSDAKAEQVLAAAVKMTGFDQGHIKTCKILEIRTVLLNTGWVGPYSAALVESDLGMKIFLFKAERNNRWWIRFYDVPKKEQNKPSETTL